MTESALLEDSSSIYTGAGLKLEAFDRFHKALNQSIPDYIFSINDAAIILKQLTPDIIKKIITLITNKKIQEEEEGSDANSEEYMDGATDLEVSEINVQKKNVPEKAYNRPDASRPARMLSSLNSNSCSPVSAAVQALISISSAPETGDTHTQSNSSAKHFRQYSNEENQQRQQVFKPLKKPISSTTAAPSIVKPAVNKETIIYSKEEINENILETSKGDPFMLAPTEHSSQSSVTTAVQTTMSNIYNDIMQSKTYSEQKYFENHPVSQQVNNFEPLPHFNLLLSAPGVVDMQCGLPSPFQQNFPSSPLVATTSHETELQKATTTSVTLLNSIDQQQFIEQQPPFPADSMFMSVRLHNPLRSILPKSDTTSNQHHTVTAAPTTIVVPSMSSTATISHPNFPPLIKIDERKILKTFSVPPNHIFPIKASASSTAGTITTTTTCSQAKTSELSAQVGNSFFFAQPHLSMDALMFSNTAKSNSAKAKRNSKVAKKSSADIIMLPRAGSRKSTDGGGNLPLEVASALLSMGNEPSTDDERLQNIIKNSKDGGEVVMSFSEYGTLKVDDVEIDPKIHQLKKDNFACGKCGRMFTSILYLSRHIKRVCPDMSQRKWKCDRCSKAFRHPFGLQQHSFTHTGERRHKCQHCVKAFYSANDLRRHERTHSGERPYECEVCKKRFSTTISLKTHSFIHSGERPHKCPHCPKAFATSSKLCRHVVTHAEKRPFTCDMCPKSFNRSGDLRRHLTQFHGKSDGLLECDLCHKVFATQRCLQQHKLTHKRDKITDTY